MQSVQTLLHTPLAFPGFLWLQLWAPGPLSCRLRSGGRPLEFQPHLAGLAPCGAFGRHSLGETPLLGLVAMSHVSFNDSP